MDNQQALEQCEQDRENEQTEIEEEDNDHCDCGGELEIEYFWKHGVRGGETGDEVCEDCGKRYKSNLI